MRYTFSGLSFNQIDPAVLTAGSKPLTTISQSQPQPYTYAELIDLIGPIESLLSPSTTLGFCPDEGTLAFREAVVNLYENLHPDHIISFAGAQEAIFCSLHALLEQGDRVVAIKPIYDPLIRTAEEIGAHVEFVELDANTRWSLDFDQLNELITPDTRCLILNFPHNPTGAMITLEELDQIIQLCRENDVWILSDEVFRGLEHDPTDRLPAVADIYEKAISLGVMSKAFSLPAIRVGWTACQNKNVREKLLTIKSYLSVCNSLFDEALAIRALNKAETILQRNRDLFLPLLDQTQTIIQNNQDFIWTQPDAGCCAYVRFSDPARSIDFFTQLAKSHALKLTSGDCFLASEKGFRIGFGYDQNPERLAHCIPHQQ